MSFFSLESTSIWRFPKRGDWSTHKGDYRGNWAPQVPRNIILKYSTESDLVLDQFLGSATTLIECRLLNRNAVGIDINPDAISISKNRLNFQSDNLSEQSIYCADAKNLSKINDSTIDLICSHPPYANIIKYSRGINEDLSLLNIQSFTESLNSVAKESFRVLKKNKYCAIMMGDIRTSGKVYPLGFRTLDIFLKNGFSLKEIIIKEQFNCSSTANWKNSSFLAKSYLIAHEYIFIMIKT